MFYQYTKFVDLDNEQYPFIVTNAPILLRTDLDEVSQAELDAPSIQIRQADSSFWNELKTNWLNHPEVDPEIIEALIGNNSSWKLIRCVFGEACVRLLLANPSLLPSKTERNIPGDYMDELKSGEVSLYLEPSPFGSIDWSFNTVHEGNIDRIYHARLSRHRLRFTESDDKGVCESSLDFEPESFGLYKMSVSHTVF